MKMTVKEPFSWAHRGVNIVQYAKGDEIETDDQDLIDVSRQEGWTGRAKASAQQSSASVPAESAVDPQQTEQRDQTDSAQA
jgi:hypothetical protein